MVEKKRFQLRYRLGIQPKFTLCQYLTFKIEINIISTKYWQERFIEVIFLKHVFLSVIRSFIARFYHSVA